MRVSMRASMRASVRSVNCQVLLTHAAARDSGLGSGGGGGDVADRRRGEATLDQLAAVISRHVVDPPSADPTASADPLVAPCVTGDAQRSRRRKSCMASAVASAAMAAAEAGGGAAEVAAVAQVGRGSRCSHSMRASLRSRGIVGGGERESAQP